jgi:hypothetical protein
MGRSTSIKLVTISWANTPLLRRKVNTHYAQQIYLREVSLPPQTHLHQWQDMRFGEPAGHDHVIVAFISVYVCLKYYIVIKSSTHFLTWTSAPDLLGSEHFDCGLQPNSASVMTEVAQRTKSVRPTSTTGTMFDRLAKSTKTSPMDPPPSHLLPAFSPRGQWQLLVGSHSLWHEQHEQVRKIRRTIHLGSFACLLRSVIGWRLVRPCNWKAARVPFIT